MLSCISNRSTNRLYAVRKMHKKNAVDQSVYRYQQTMKTILIDFISRRFFCIFTIRGQIGGVKTADILQYVG